MKLTTVRFEYFLLFFLVSFYKVLEVRTDSYCAKIYSKGNYEGSHLTLRTNEQISDFEDLKSTNWVSSNSSFSFKLQQNCFLTLGSEPFTRGNIEVFDGDTENISLPASLSCTCDQICNCSQISPKYTECGRAYLGKECSYCNAFYASLKEGRRVEIPERISERIKSIVLREGCVFQPSNGGTLTSKSTYEKWTGNFTSYACSCDPNIKRKISQTNSVRKDFPPLIEMPKTRGLINSKLRQDGFKDHPGLVAGLQSLRVRRSSKNAYILLLGLSGTGKSTTINFLFEHPNITKVGNIASTTTDIHEYRIPITVEELGMKNGELRIVDTPGIADTRGIIQDAQFLATLDDFLSKHEELKWKLPNLVLIFLNFHDNRFEGHGSSFVKMLRTIDLFRDRIIDRKSSNVVFVLTHYMSETKEITRNPIEKLSKIKKVIREYSTLPNPIVLVLGENKPEEHYLPILNGYYRLPNGEFYPQNLFAQMQRSLVSSGDPIGNGIIQTAFRDSENFRIIGKTFPLISKTNTKVTRYLGILGSLDTPIDNTEVSEILDLTYKTLTSNELKAIYPETILTHLKRVCYHTGIHQLEDLPKTSTQILKFLEEIQQNPLSAHLIQKSFNMTIPLFKGFIMIGSGYDLLNDRPLPTPILNMSHFTPTETGFQLPSSVQIRLLNQVEPIFSMAPTMNQAVEQRWKDIIGEIGYDELGIDSGLYRGNLRSGYNVIGNESVTSLTAAIDYRIFEGSLKTKNYMQLDSEFLTTLRSLPIFNVSDWDGLEKWKNYFVKYGTHVVSSAYGGGSIQISVNFLDTFHESPLKSLTTAESLSLLAEGMENVIKYLATTFIGKETELEIPYGLTYTILIEGGDSRFRYLLSNLTHNELLDEERETSNILDRWEASVKYEPIMLHSQLTLVPMTKLLKEVDINDVDFDKENIIVEIEMAAKSLFNASLVYIPIQPVRRPPASREDAGNGGQGVAIGDFEAIQEFAKLFQNMKEESNKLQERYFNLMTESQNEARKDEELWEKRRIERLKLKQEADFQEREEIKLEKQMALQQRQFEEKQRLDQMALESQIELSRQTMQAQQAALMQKIAQDQQQGLLNFISAENQRISEENRNRKSWFDKTLDFMHVVAGNAAQAATIAAPLAVAAG